MCLCVVFFIALTTIKWYNINISYKGEKFMKKMFLAILTLILLTCSLGLTACSNEPEHKHDYVLSMYNETKHWDECVCGYKHNIENHSYEMLHNELKHWQECVCGAKTNVEEHIGGQATCTEKAQCTVCDSEYGKLKEHNYTILRQNGADRWNECACGDKSTVGLEFSLITNDTEYEVIDYTGDSNNVYIPLIFNGKPVTSIGYEAFYNCDSLTSIVIPDNITSIGNRAFYDCSSLTNIVLPDSVTSIGSYAFSSCSSLTSVVIPDNITSIGDYAFVGCSSLTSIDVAEDNPNYKDIDGNLYSKDGTTLIQYAIGQTATEFTVPANVTSIGDYAFFYCKSLTSIEIPDSVQSIGDCTFLSCESLTSIEIPDSVTSIGYGVFAGCSSLTSIEIPASVTSIGEYAFSSCSSLTIYCEAESMPIGWNSSWNYSNRPVVWGYKG